MQRGDKMSNNPVPAYRIYSVPERLVADQVDTHDPEIRERLTQPIHRRPNGFGYSGLSNIRLTSEGIKGFDSSIGLEMILLENGYLELSCPLRNGAFQWRKQAAGFADKDWLYPYTVAEMPVSFLHIAKDLYERANVTSRIHIRQEYRSIRGFVLVGGHPGSPLFGRNAKVFEEDNLIGKMWPVEPSFDPDELAKRFIKEVYDAFGFENEDIPVIAETSLYERV